MTTDYRPCNVRHPNPFMFGVRCVLDVAGRKKHKGPHWDGKQETWTTSMTPR